MDDFWWADGGGGEGVAKEDVCVMGERDRPSTGSSCWRPSGGTTEEDAGVVKVKSGVKTTESGSPGTGAGDVDEDDDVDG